MTISTQNISVEYTANGTDTQWSFDFVCYDEEALIVEFNGVPQTLIRKVINDEQQSSPGGLVSVLDELGAELQPVPVAGTVIRIEREQPYTQTTSFPTSGKFPAKATEYTFDRIVMMIQQLYQYVVSVVIGSGFLQSDDDASISGQWTFLQPITGSVTGSAASAATASLAGDSGLLQGQNGAFYRNAGNLNAGLVPDARVPASSVVQHQGSLSIAWTQLTGTKNADLLQGQNGAFYRNAGNLNAGLIPDARVPSSAVSQHQGLLSIDWTQLTGTKNADLLQGQNEAFYRNASNLNVGTLPGQRFDDTSHGTRSGGSLHALANTSSPGFMSSADKQKLDALELSAIEPEWGVAGFISVTSPTSYVSVDLSSYLTPNAGDSQEFKICIVAARANDFGRRFLTMQFGIGNVWRQDAIYRINNGTGNVAGLHVGYINPSAGDVSPPFGVDLYGRYYEGISGASEVSRRPAVFSTKAWGYGDQTTDSWQIGNRAYFANVTGCITDIRFYSSMLVNSSQVQTDGIASMKIIVYERRIQP
jgi:hypothetical protein